MTPQQIRLVQSSFTTVAAQSEAVATLFYGKLFELNPAARSLFKGDMTIQGKKLMQMIGMVVVALNRLETIVPAIQALGVRHVHYGVNESDYETVGAALLWTLRQGLGNQFDADTEGAWVTAYTLLATTMKDAAHAAVSE